MIKVLIKKLASYAGFERIVRRPTLQTFLEHHQVDLVIDVGANTGQFGQELRKGGYKGKIHSFEPIRDVFRMLEDASANDPLWTVTNAGIGSSRGNAQINVAEFSVYSSIKPISSVGTAFDTRTSTLRTEEISVVTLTDVLSDKLSDSIFIKIDTQGFEREVLQGAVEVLPHCVGVQLELPVEHLYQDVWSFSDAVAYMANLGFVPAQFDMVNTLRDDPSSGVEFDCIFRRSA